MPRDLPLGNGSLLVTFDKTYQTRDLFHISGNEVGDSANMASASGSTVRTRVANRVTRSRQSISLSWCKRNVPGTQTEHPQP